MFGKIIQEMYGYTLLEYFFFLGSGLISLICVLFALFVSFKHFRQTDNSSTRIIFYSILCLLVSEIIAALVFNSKGGESLDLIELFVYYLPTLFFVSLVIGFYRLCRDYNN
ncbi:hypothetical protein [Glaciecola sp. MF2-115]|uniref:hypothetical protein n=1 Tax=Glaciecola sp. MF2-115 TaxID=3384827 RepID=UPI0039A1FDE5